MRHSHSLDSHECTVKLRQTEQQRFQSEEKLYECWACVTERLKGNEFIDDLCCHRNLERFAVRLTKSRRIILPVQAVAEVIFIWAGWPRRCV